MKVTEKLGRVTMVRVKVVEEKIVRVKMVRGEDGEGKKVGRMKDV
jgi:hypothetical protein